MSRVVKLEELCIPDQIGKYGIPAVAEEFSEDKVRYLRITDIDDYGNLLENDKKSVSSPEIEKYILKEGDIVFARTGNSTGRTYFHEEENGELAFAGFLIKFSLDESKVNPKYLKYFTISKPYKQWVDNLSNGSTRGNINAKTFADCPIILPPRAQQDYLVRVLSSLEEKIQINDQINQELEAMAKTLYDYWFVQFDFPDQNGKPYKSSGGKMVYSPELKLEIPEGWGVESVGNLLDKVTKAEKIENNSIEFVGRIPVIDQSQKYIAGFTNNKNSLIQPQNGHVIFGDHTRVVKFINFDYARGADGTQVLISNNENISNILLYHMIEDFDLSNYGYARHFKFLKEKLVIVPDKKISLKFANKADVIYKKIRNNIFENQELTQLRDWLLPMLMNVQVKVQDFTI
jgi:type I restriction enzyme, S subunit